MAYATTINTIPNLHTKRYRSPPFRHHAARSREASVQCQPSSLPQHQTFVILRSPPASEPQSAYDAAVFESSPAQLPALEHSPEWEHLPSGTDDKITLQPTTPYYDANFYPADLSVYNPCDGYNKTPSMGPSDEASLYHQIHGSNYRSTSAYNDIDTGGSSLKRSRTPTSPPSQILRRKHEIEKQA